MVYMYISVYKVIVYRIIDKLILSRELTVCHVFTGAQFSKVFLFVGDVKLLFFVAVFPCLVCLAPD